MAESATFRGTYVGKIDARTTGERIKELRESEGYNLQQFAERIGSKATTVNTWERGKTEPPRIAIKAIAAEFGASEDWLLTGLNRTNDPTAATRKKIIAWINAIPADDLMALARVLRLYNEK